MMLLATMLLGILLAGAVALWWHLRARRRQLALIRLLDGADELERLLQRTRARMQAMRAVIHERVPADIAAQARASLEPDRPLEDALREVLQHRLWIQRHGDRATQVELDEACAAMDRVRARITGELDRLDRAGAELDEATEAALAAAEREPPTLRRGSQ